MCLVLSPAAQHGAGCQAGGMPKTRPPPHPDVFAGSCFLPGPTTCLYKLPAAAVCLFAPPAGTLAGGQAIQESKE